MPGLNYSNSLWDGKTGLWDGNTGLWCGVSGLALVSESLFLNFLTGSLDPRITFSRGSQATLTDSTGKITYAPNNLLTNSESFEASAWTKGDATVTANAIAAPNGTTTADSVVETTTTAVHRIFQFFTAASTVPFVISVYAKAIGSRRLYVNAMAIGNVGALFDLTGSGSVVNLAGTATNKAAIIEAVGSGWYRCTIVGTGTGSANNAYFQINRSTSTTATDDTYLGDGTSGLTLWGAQLEQVTYQTTPGTYTSTTPKNLLGYTQEFDNAAWTKSNAFVQTNLLVQSQAFNNVSWLSDDITTTDNSVPAPFGTALASTITETLVSSDHRLITAATPSFTAGQSYTLSIYVKNVNRNFVQLGFGTAPFSSTAYANFDISTGVLGTVGAGTTATITAVGGGWYRCSIAVTAAVTTTASAFLALVTSATAGRSEIYTGTGLSVNVFGAQLVQGSTAGNYQPTYAAAAAVQYPAPDNSLTADKLVEDTATSTHNIRSTSISLVSGTTYYSSAYVSAAGRTRLQLINFNGSSDVITTFDLSTGSVVSGSGSITSVGGGWFKVSQFFTAGATVSTPYAFQVFLVNTGTTTNYTGDGTSGIYIWGAQLSNSASLDPYVYNPGAAPTSAAYYGPRFDYDPVTLAAKGLLIEEQRTNLLTYSSDWSNAAWSKTNITVTAASTMSPDGSVNAQKLAATAAASTSITQGAIVAATSATYTIYVKQGTGATTANTFGIRNVTSATNLVFFTFNYATGAIAYSVGTTGASATAVGDGWWRIQISATTGITSGNSIIVYVGWTGGGAAAGDFLYAYGAQLEAGAFATSYIPTVASQVTRSADVATMVGANFSNWYNQSEGTIVASASVYSTGLSGNRKTLVAITEGNFNNVARLAVENGTSAAATVAVGGATQASFSVSSSVSANTLFKTDLAMKANDFAFCVNAGSVSTDTSGSVLASPIIFNIGFGPQNSSGSTNTPGDYTNGHIRSVSYYNTRLGNATLQALTV